MVLQYSKIREIRSCFFDQSEKSSISFINPIFVIVFKTPKSTLSTNREQGTATNPRLIRDYKPRPGKKTLFFDHLGPEIRPKIRFF